MTTQNARFLAAFFLATLLAVNAVVADDRDLLRDAAGQPYMFVVMDTSGSMHWTPACTEGDACLDIDPWDGMCTSECTVGAAACERLCPDWGCVEYDFGLEPPRDVEVIMDTEDGAGVEIIGDWREGGIRPWIGDNYLHNRNSGQGNKSIRFTPNLPESGTYMVYLFWSSNNSRASNVPVDVTHTGGTTRVLMNQRSGHGEYNYVGSFDFDAGTSGDVLIGTENTNGYVAVDTVRFYSLIKPDPPPPCLREGYRCQQPLCPNGDCYAPLNGDDPTSKFYQAKEAMFEVLSQADDVHFGLGTYEQDNGRLKAKHWLYRVSEYKPTSEGFAPETSQDLWFDDDPDSIPFPQVGAGYVFGNGPPYDDNGRGDGWHCASDDNYPGKDGDPEGDAGHVGCFLGEPADADSPWELERFRRIPKLGLNARTRTTTWYRRDDQVYRVRIDDVTRLSDGSAFEYGDEEFAVEFEVRECSNDDCSDGTTTTERIYFELVSDYAAWEGELGRAPMHENGYFNWQRNVDAGNTCNGLEPNDDRNANVDPNLAFSDDDTWWDYTFKWPTSADPRGDTVTDSNGDLLPRVNWFDTGDFIPIDWLRTNKNLVLQRMAPNVVGGDLNPDFRTAIYWRNDYVPGSDEDSPTNRRLRLRDELERPLLSHGSTPIAASLADFRSWYGGTDDQGDKDGWAGTAAERDIDFACRQKYVLFLTDGNETCGGDPCDAARQLLNAGVKTFVVGFGLDDDSSDLGCIAFEGGTDEPILPRNKQELIEALEDILLRVRAESRAFASASLPALQSAAADKIYLSSFIPLPDQGFWPGEIDVFRKPLPLKEGRPDTTRKCIDGETVRQSGCHLHEVGQLLVENQTPSNTELLEDPPYFRIGDGRSERRVLYGQANRTGRRPNQLTLFRTPYRGADGNDLADLADLGDVLAEESTMASFYSGLATADEVEAEIHAVMTETLRAKSLGDAADEERDAYVLGDIFHANPLVVTSPNDFNYFSQDLCGKVQSKQVPNNCVEGVDRGYRNFALDHTWRRRLLAVATNDGQLHFFDAGVRTLADFDADPDDPTNEITKVEVFTDGTGEELFSYMPRLTLPVVREQANRGVHIFSIDGEMSIHDVFIDPANENGSVNPTEREWRTVLVGGLREGGDVYETANDVDDYVSGYFALDLTQPDLLKQRESDRVVNEDGTLGAFNDPPRDSLLPVNTTLDANTVDLPSCLAIDYSETGHQVTQTLGNGADGIFPCKYPFPAELWTFTDTVENGLYFLDEEANPDGTFGNGVRDLGDTWSQPVIGQIAVCGLQNGKCNPQVDGSDLTTLHVAIFGGGMDAQFKNAPQRGYWLYMVNIETGEAIYKRRLDGAAPSDPAVIDRDLDGIFDSIYIGTTNGTLYKVDLDGRDSNGDLPYLGAVNVRDRLLPAPGPGDPIWVNRLQDQGGWEPYPILATADNVPIYFPPSAFFIPEANAYGLAVGAGDREDLWLPADKEGRFYVIVDDGITRDDFLMSGVATPCIDRIPIKDNCLVNVAWDQEPPTVTVDGVVQVDQSIDYLAFPEDPSDTTALRPGWVMTFPADHRLTASPLVVSGVLIYSMFQPVAFLPDVVNPDDDVVCARTGTTRSFVVLARNANPLARLSAQDQGDATDSDNPPGGGGGGGATSGALKARDRYHQIREFTTAPFVDRVSSKNAPEDGGANVNDLLDSEIANELEKVLMESYPRGSRFNNAYKLVVAALRNSTGVNVYAKVPIAIYPADWKEVTGLPVASPPAVVEPPPIDPPLVDPPPAAPPAESE